MANGPSAAMNSVLGVARDPTYAGGLFGNGPPGPSLTAAEINRMMAEVGIASQPSPTTMIAEHADMVFQSVRAKNGHIIIASKRGSGSKSDIHIVPEGMTPGQMIDTILTTSKLDGK